MLRTKLCIRVHWILLFIFLSLFFFFGWNGLGYIFGCDLISYDLILLSLWICVHMILARESIFRLGYFSFFLFVVIFLTIMLFCTCRKVGLLRCIFLWNVKTFWNNLLSDVQDCGGCIFLWNVKTFWNNLLSDVQDYGGCIFLWNVTTFWRNLLPDVQDYCWVHHYVKCNDVLE